mgnify:CR=1 FL=1
MIPVGSKPENDLSDFERVFMASAKEILWLRTRHIKPETKLWLEDVYHSLIGCEVEKKPLWLLFPTQVTTVSQYKIYLARNFISWKPDAMQRCLCHEAAHLAQRRTIKSDRSFTFHYLTSSDFRINSEIEAECWKLRHMKIVAPNSQPNISQLAKDLINDHLVSSSYYVTVFDRLSDEWAKTI